MCGEPITPRRGKPSATLHSWSTRYFVASRGRFSTTYYPGVPDIAPMALLSSHNSVGSTVPNIEDLVNTVSSMVNHQTKVIDDRQSREPAVLDPIDRKALYANEALLHGDRGYPWTTASLSNFPFSRFLSSQKGFRSETLKYVRIRSAGISTAYRVTSMTLSLSISCRRQNKLVANSNDLTIPAGYNQNDRHFFTRLVQKCDITPTNTG